MQDANGYAHAYVPQDSCQEIQFRNDLERENGSISFRPGNFADFVSSARSLSVVANANSSNNKPLTISPR